MPKALWFLGGFAMAVLVGLALIVGPLTRSAASPAGRPISAPTALAPGPPVAPPEPTATPLASRLEWRREGGLVGLHGHLEIPQINAVYYTPGEGGPRFAHLTEDERDAYGGFLARYAPFDYTVQTYQGGMQVTTRLEFVGQGGRVPVEAEQAEVARWAGGVYERLVEAEKRNDLVARARLHLAQRVEIAVDDIETVSVTPVTWPDACLGIRETGLFCAQVMTPGYQIRLKARDRLYEYRSDLHGLLRAGDLEASLPVSSDRP
ncbi:MAG: hypothetical protein JXA74_10935 [Anaerolineae bacterium]|nr:hypothetical protein [Anaerolineae bacterium]